VWPALWVGLLLSYTHSLDRITHTPGVSGQSDVAPCVWQMNAALVTLATSPPVLATWPAAPPSAELLLLGQVHSLAAHSSTPNSSSFVIKSSRLGALQLPTEVCQKKPSYPCQEHGLLNLQHSASCSWCFW
jgi:hypothetical protein